jgi:hypothetical protein
MNIIPKHDGQETVANFDSQYLHCDESDEIAAPQFGQLRFCAFIVVRSARILRAPAGILPRFNYPLALQAVLAAARLKLIISG